MASQLPARNLAGLERVTATTTPLLAEERLGRDTTHSACGDTDKRLTPELDNCDLQSDCRQVSKLSLSKGSGSYGGNGAVVRAVRAAVQTCAVLFPRSLNTHTTIWPLALFAVEVCS